MDKLGITDREKKLLFIVMAILILVASYFLGFVKLNEKAAVIEESNEKDAATVAQLQSMFDRQEETKKETENYKKTIANIIEKYPVDVPQEKTIYLLKGMQDIVLLDMDNINFKMNNLMLPFSGENSPRGCYDDMTIHYNATYGQFKDLIQYVLDFADRTTIPRITANFDESTGYLEGNMTYRMYYLTNTEKEYVDVPPTGIELGLPNLFHTADDYWEFESWPYDDNKQLEEWATSNPFETLKEIREALREAQAQQNARQ